MSPDCVTRWSVLSRAASRRTRKACGKGRRDDQSVRQPPPSTIPSMKPRKRIAGHGWHAIQPYLDRVIRTVVAERNHRVALRDAIDDHHGIAVRGIELRDGNV